MLKQTLELNELVYTYTPRKTGVSLVLASLLTDKLPTQLHKELQVYSYNKSFNPDFIILISGKNQNKWYLDKTKPESNLSFSNNPNFEIKYSNFGYFQRLAVAELEPAWLLLANRNNNFSKLFEVMPVLKGICNLPFVRNVYICHSQALEQMQEYSDIDLIIQTGTFFGVPTVVISRFWVKLYLKVMNRDVHPFVLHYLTIISHKLKLKNLENFLELKLENFKKSSFTKIDTGIFIDARLDLNHYTSNDIDRLGYQLKKVVLREKDLNKYMEPNFSLFLDSFKYQPNIFIKYTFSLSKVFIELFSILIYPVFLIQILWYWLLNRHNLNQFVSFTIWHSFTKAVFNNNNIVKLKDKVYLYH